MSSLTFDNWKVNVVVFASVSAILEKASKIDAEPNPYNKDKI
jgi:hypothetical protein